MYHSTWLASNINPTWQMNVGANGLWESNSFTWSLSSCTHVDIVHPRTWETMCLGRWTFERIWSRRVGSVKCLAEWHCSLCGRRRSRRGYIWRNHSRHGSIRRLNVITHLLHVLHDDVERHPREALWPHPCHCKHTSGQCRREARNRLSSWSYQWR